MSRAGRIAAVLAAALLCSGHVGSPDVWYDGEAGPYPVRVIVRMPGVVPGLADISIRVRGGGVDRVEVGAGRWDLGPEGAPPPDVAKPVRGDPELHSAQLWLMTRGAHRITVTVAGGRGTGSVVVPVMATATDRLEMSAGTGFGLAGGGIFLFIGLLTLVRAAVRESVVPPGEAPDRRRRRRARWAVGIAGVVAAALLFGGWSWWSAVDSAYRARIDRPWAAEARVRAAPGGERVLEFAIADSLWIRRNDPAVLARFGRPLRTPLIPDHGKLMHMFMVREPDLAGFAHLHPVSVDSVRFDVTIPPLPEGRYTVYADVVQESGTTHTLVTDVELTALAPGEPTAAGAGPARDPDDAWWQGAPLGSLTGSARAFDDGPVMHWRTRGPLRAGQEVELRVELVEADGSTARIRPYMGMMGHAAVRRDDGAVFVHLHPTGTISMASQRALEMREPDDTAFGAVARRLSAAGGMDPHAMHALEGQGLVAFPYAFPQPGRYRIWVQLLHDGRVRTGAFDVVVEP